MKNVGLILILLGVVLAATGVLVYAGVNFSWLGRLPGDIRIERPGMRFYFPLTTCLLISIIISLIFYLIRMLK